jgi:glycosyltransferase involved in cell wall biosynthesis
MKITIVSSEFPPMMGGAGVYIYQYALALSQLGHSVTVITSVCADEIDFGAVTVIRVDRKSIIWPFLFYKKYQNKNSDLVLLNDPSAIYMAGLFFSKVDYKKSICFLHGSEAKTVYSSPGLGRKCIFFSSFYTKALFNSKFIVFPSEFMKKQFIKDVGERISFIQNKSIVSYGGVDQDVFWRGNNELLDNHKLELLTVCRLTRMKGFDSKLNLIKDLVNNHKVALKWTIIGDGDYKEALYKKVVSEKLTNYVEFKGRVDRNKLRGHYIKADVFLLLSDYDESFGLVYLEASSCGLPSIGYRKGGVVEAIQDGVNGCLVNNWEEARDGILSGNIASIKPKDCIGYSCKFNVLSLVGELLSKIR